MPRGKYQSKFRNQHAPYSIEYRYLDSLDIQVFGPQARTLEIIVPGGSFLIDECDLDIIKDRKWIINANGYPSTTIYSGTGGMGRGKSTPTLLHRVLTNPPKGFVVDHINRNKKDNRRVNLRLCTHRQNCANSPRPIPKSGYRGVHQITGRNRWKSKVSLLLPCGTKKQVYGPSRKTPKEAAIDYNLLASKHFGEFAILNEVTH